MRQVFTRRKNECRFFVRTEKNSRTFIFVWVDEIRVASRSMTVTSDVEKVLQATIRMEDKGRLHGFLALTRGQSYIGPKMLHGKMLEWYQLDQCKPSRTPADLNLKLQTAQNGDDELDDIIYRTLVGCFHYSTKQTMPVIVCTVNIPSRDISAPTNQDWQCGKRFLRYPLGSKC